MKILLLFIFLIIQPVSKEQIYNNTGFTRSEAINYNINCYSSPQIHKVRGYDIYGNEINTDGMGNPSDPSKGMWQDGYLYFQDEYGYWYRTKDGKTWEKWSSLFDWGVLMWGWRSGRPPSGVITQYWKEKPTPIGSCWILLLFIGIYIIKNNVWNK